MIDSSMIPPSGLDAGRGVVSEKRAYTCCGRELSTVLCGSEQEGREHPLRFADGLADSTYSLKLLKRPRQRCLDLGERQTRRATGGNRSELVEQDGIPERPDPLTERDEISRRPADDGEPRPMIGPHWHGFGKAFEVELNLLCR
jgi:hypothetical protein